MVRGELHNVQLMFITIGQTFPDNQMTDRNVYDVEMASHSSSEDHASDILRHHYGTLSQYLQHPISVAQQLHKEKMISRTTRNIVKTTAESLPNQEPISLLLKAVRHAVHTKYYNLEVFASVLLKQTSNVPYGMAILKDYGKYVI